MARFNQRASEPTKTTNIAGGEAFKESAELELVSILLTSFVKDQFYSTATDIIKNVGALLDRVDPVFAAKAAIYARTKFGMRSISHVVAGELCKRVSGQPWMKDFLNAVVFRPDDILEIASYYDTRKNKETHAMRKGLGAAMSRFGEYQLAKYRGDGKAISMVDLANIFHPQNTPAIKKLIAGELKNTNTWEAKLTETGKAETQEEQAELKNAAWSELLKTKKLGYFALLRNLRNIIEQSPESLSIALEQLVNESAIRKSLVLPFRFITAQEEIAKLPGKPARDTMNALSDAMDKSVSNCPELSGRTLVALDCSGSMSGKPYDIGSLFTAALYKRCNADIILFDSSANYLTLASSDSVMSLVTQLKGEFRNGGTDFKPIFEEMTKRKEAYDRVIILSDMQAWQGYRQPERELNSYRRTIGKNPHIYSIDLAGHGTLQFPEKNVYALAGFSEKLFDIMKMLGQDRNALINEIKKVEFKVTKETKHKRPQVEEVVVAQ